MTPSLARTLNAIGLLGLSLVLSAAFADQFLADDVPCPLCLLQRAGMMIAGVGIALNITVGPRPAHYAMAIVSALAGGAASLRQIALHVVPGTGSYGDAFMDLHFYSWAFVTFAAIVLGSAIMLFFENQFADATYSTGADELDRPRLSGLALIGIALFALLALANTVSTVAECELGLCPDNPTGYDLFNRSAPAE